MDSDSHEPIVFLKLLNIYIYCSWITFQVIVVIFLQFLIGQELEVVAGWLRVAIIYVLSAIGGLAVSMYL